jgi:quercetin dioxygenase-like cupin family protein
MMTHIPIVLTVISLGALVSGAMAQTRAPSPISDEHATIQTKAGATETVHTTVQVWPLPGQGDGTHEIPIRGFYMAHLTGGHVAATVGNRTTNYLPGDFWVVPAGAVMQVKVLGEGALLETTVVAKQ